MLTDREEQLILLCVKAVKHNPTAIADISTSAYLNYAQLSNELQEIEFKLEASAADDALAKLEREGQIKLYDEALKLVRRCAITKVKQTDTINKKKIDVFPWTTSAPIATFFSVDVNGVMASFKCGEDFAVKTIVREVAKKGE